MSKFGGSGFSLNSNSVNLGFTEDYTPHRVTLRFKTTLPEFGFVAYLDPDTPQYENLTCNLIYAFSRGNMISVPTSMGLSTSSINFKRGETDEEIFDLGTELINTAAVRYQLIENFEQYLARKRANNDGGALSLAKIVGGGLSLLTKKGRLSSTDEE